MPERVAIKAGDFTVRATIVQIDSYVSRSTEKTLDSLEVEFRTDNEQQSQLVHAFLAKPEPVEIQGSENTKRFRIGENSYSTNGSPTIVFSWELLEMEELKVEKLVINDDFELIPYRYKEEFENNDRLTITIRVELTEAEEAKLRALPDYFHVIRKGINDVPREMRMGQVLWSRSGDKYKMRMHLFDKAEDNVGGVFLQPEFSNLAILAAETSLQVSALIELLAKKQIISQQEADGVLSINEQRCDRELHNLDRVKDLDEWLKSRGYED